MEEYCLCRTQYEEDNERFMIACDYCEDWFHGDCIGIMSQDGDKLDGYLCDQCKQWQDKREQLLYQIISNKSMTMEVLGQIKSFKNGIMSAIVRKYRMIDYLIIAETWNKISRFLLSSSRDISVITEHLRLIEQIPINCESKILLLTQIVRQNLISASSVVQDFERLKDLEIKDVITDDLQVNEEAVEHNANVLSQLEDACKGLQQSQIDKSPGLLRLTKSIQGITALKGVADFYNPQFKGDRSIEKYQKLLEQLKASTYKGDLIATMAQEIEDYRKFVEDAEYILEEEANKGSCFDGISLESESEDDTEQTTLDYNVRLWRFVINNKLIDKKSFTKVLRNGKELKIDIKTQLEGLQRIENDCVDFEKRLNDKVLKSKERLDLTEVEKLILEGLELVILPKQSLLKAISLYKKLEELRLNADNVLNPRSLSLYSFKDLQYLFKELSLLPPNQRPIPDSKYDELWELHTKCENLTRKVENLKSSKLSDLEAFYNSAKTSVHISLPWLITLQRQILLSTLLSPSASQNPIDSSITEIEVALEDYSNKAFKLKGVEHEQAWAQIQAQIDFTKKVLKKRKTKEGITHEDVMDLKQKGILLTSIMNEYESAKSAEKWFMNVSKEVQKLKNELAESEESEPKQVNMLGDFRELLFLGKEKISKYLSRKESIYMIVGEKPLKLLKSLSCARWMLEYNEVLQGEGLTKQTRKRLRNLGKELNLRPDYIDEYAKIVESYEYIDLFENFIHKQDCLNDIDRVLKLKSSSTLDKLKELYPKIENNEKKKAKLGKLIEHVKLSMLICKVVKQLKSSVDLPPDLFGLKKVSNNKNPDSPSARTKSESENPNETRADREYEKVTELLDIIETRGLPKETYWYTYLRDQIIQLEQWQKGYWEYDDWKSRNQGKMQDQIKRAKESYTIEMLKTDFLQTADNLIIPVDEECKVLNEDIKAVEDWISKAEEFIWKMTIGRRKAKTAFNKLERSSLESLLVSMNELPLLSSKFRPTMLEVIVYEWLSKAEQYLWVIKQKEDSDDETDEDDKFNKRSYDEWMALKTKIDPYKDHEMLSRHGIYTEFIDNLQRATKIYNIVHKNKQSHLKADPDKVEVLCMNARNNKIDFSKEIEMLREGLAKQQQVREKLKASYQEHPTIEKLLEHYEMIREFEYGFDEEQKKFKQIKKIYEQGKRKFTIMMKTSPSKSEKKPLLSNAQHEIRLYESLNFTYQEGEDFKNFLTATCQKFKEIYRDVKQALLDKDKMNWDLLLQFKKRLRELPLDFENEEKELKNKFKKLESSAILGSFRIFLKIRSKQKPIKASETSGPAPSSSNKEPLKPEEMIPYKKVKLALSSFKQSKIKERQEQQDLEEYRMDIDDGFEKNSQDQDTADHTKNIEEMTDRELMEELSKYKSATIKEIKSFGVYKDFKEYCGKLQKESIIDFSEAIDPKKKELRKEYMIIKRKERIEQEKQKDELMKQKLSPDEYKQYLRQRKIKRLASAKKTDWTIDNGSDEEWDQETMKHAEADIAMDWDDSSDNEKLKIKPKAQKSSKSPKKAKPKDPKDVKVSNPKKEKASKAPKAKKSSKSPVKKRDAKAAQKSPTKNKPSAAEAAKEEARKLEQKAKCDSTLERLKQKLSSNKSGDQQKQKVMESLIKARDKENKTTALSSAIHLTLAKARGEKQEEAKQKEESSSESSSGSGSSDGEGESSESDTDSKDEEEEVKAKEKSVEKKDKPVKTKEKTKESADSKPTKVLKESAPVKAKASKVAKSKPEQKCESKPKAKPAAKPKQAASKAAQKVKKIAAMPLDTDPKAEEEKEPPKQQIAPKTKLVLPKKSMLPAQTKKVDKFSKQSEAPKDECNTQDTSINAKKDEEDEGNSTESKAKADEAKAVAAAPAKLPFKKLTLKKVAGSKGGLAASLNKFK